ncbi:MAG TPA: type II toxin-antitoxin system RelE/ParE family toxin [Burkholderiales bacterium]
MADYAVVFARSARKELQNLDPQVARRIVRVIEALINNPRPSGVVKLEGAIDLWRVRVGEWRVVYRISDRERLVDVIAVRRRRDAYR